jgi:predicted nucleic acid-binding protein
VGRYLIDTDILIDYSWAREPSFSLILVMLASKDELGICAVQLAEIYAGQERGERHDFDAFLDGFPCWDITPSVGILAGSFRRLSSRGGRTIQTPDALNAAVAFHVEATIVTRNAKDYPMAEVEVLVP